MDFTDTLWWSVWWFWIMVWGGTIVAITVAVAIIVTHRRQSAHTITRPKLGSPIYLDHASVMDLYHMYGGKYKAALSREIEEEISKSHGTELSAELASSRAGGHHNMSSKVLSRYMEKAQPITVIGIVIDVLDEANDIVYVDLHEGAVTWNHALDKALTMKNHEHPSAIKLSELNAFVLARGTFSPTNEIGVFQAPYGDGQLYITCSPRRLRNMSGNSATDDFHASCLGRVKNWDRDARRLILDPTAIFS